MQTINELIRELGEFRQDSELIKESASRSEKAVEKKVLQDIERGETGTWFKTQVQEMMANRIKAILQNIDRQDISFGIDTIVVYPTKNLKLPSGAFIPGYGSIRASGHLSDGEEQHLFEVGFEFRSDNWGTPAFIIMDGKKYPFSEDGFLHFLEEGNKGPEQAPEAPTQAPVPTDNSTETKINTFLQQRMDAMLAGINRQDVLYEIERVEVLPRAQVPQYKDVIKKHRYETGVSSGYAVAHGTLDADGKQMKFEIAFDFSEKDWDIEEIKVEGVPFPFTPEAFNEFLK